MADKTRHVLDRLPEHRNALRERMMVDPEFRSLCEDYGEALEALRRWEVSSDQHQAVRVAEYQRLVADLESEIRAESVSIERRAGRGIPSTKITALSAVAKPELTPHATKPTVQIPGEPRDPAASTARGRGGAHCRRRRPGG